MPSYIVTFELKDSAVQPGLWEALKSYSSYCPLNATSWAIMTDKKAIEIRDHLATKLGPDDRLFVIRSGSEGAWRNSYGKENDEWLKKNL